MPIVLPIELPIVLPMVLPIGSLLARCSNLYSDFSRHMSGILVVRWVRGTGGKDSPKPSGKEPGQATQQERVLTIIK